MDVKTLNVSFSKTSAKNKQPKIALPQRWVAEMGITEESKKVLLSFQDGVITIKKAE